MAESEIKRQYTRLQKKLDDLGIKHSYESDDVFEHFLTIDIKNGKETRQLFIAEDEIEKYKSFDFSKYVFLGDYEGIASYTDGYIEASFESPSRNTAAAMRLAHRFAKADDEGATEYASKLIKRSVGKPSVSVRKREIELELSEPSPDFTLLTMGSGEFSLKIRGLTFERHDAAVELLEKLANAFFFEVDANIGTTFVLRRRRRRVKTIGRRVIAESKLDFPRFEYDTEPMSLFWYSKTAVGMPLIQFLALYQVIEFYFPTYSTKDAQRKIRGIVKDPTFRVDRDADIGRLLNSIRYSKWAGIGSEREQLRTTIEECVDEEAMLEFLLKNTERQEFLAKSHPGLCSEKISSHGKADPRPSVANAIYEIRCKIVHTKGDSGFEDGGRLLPYAKEADKLDYYIELVEFLARKILVAANGPLSI